MNLKTENLKLPLQDSWYVVRDHQSIPFDDLGHRDFLNLIARLLTPTDEGYPPRARRLLYFAPLRIQQRRMQVFLILYIAFGAIIALISLGALSVLVDVTKNSFNWLYFPYMISLSIWGFGAIFLAFQGPVSLLKPKGPTPKYEDTLFEKIAWAYVLAEYLPAGLVEDLTGEWNTEYIRADLQKGINIHLAILARTTAGEAEDEKAQVEKLETRQEMKNIITISIHLGIYGAFKTLAAAKEAASKIYITAFGVQSESRMKPLQDPAPVAS